MLPPINSKNPFISNSANTASSPLTTMSSAISFWFYINYSPNKLLLPATNFEEGIYKESKSVLIRYRH